MRIRLAPPNSSHWPPLIQQATLLLMLFAYAVANWLTMNRVFDVPLVSQSLPFAYLALLGTMFLLGPARFPWRLPLVILLAWSLWLWTQDIQDGSPSWPSAALVGMSVVLVPLLLIARCCCLAIRRNDDPETLGTLQFSLRGMLVLMAITGVGVALSRTLRWSEPGLASPTYLFTTLGICFGLQAILLTWFVLRLRNVWVGVVLAALTPLCLGGMHAYLCQIATEWPAFLLAQVGFTITFGMPLVILRLAQCRVVSRAIPLDFLPSWFHSLRQLNRIVGGGITSHPHETKGAYE